MKIIPFVLIIVLPVRAFDFNDSYTCTIESTTTIKTSPLESELIIKRTIYDNKNIVVKLAGINSEKPTRSIFYKNVPIKQISTASNHITYTEKNDKSAIMWTLEAINNNSIKLIKQDYISLSGSSFIVSLTFHRCS